MDELDKQVIIYPEEVSRELVQTAVTYGIRNIYAKNQLPEELSIEQLNLYIEEPTGQIKIASREGVEESIKIIVKEPEDIEKILSAVEKGYRKIFVDTYSWKIIPLENIVAELQKMDVKLYAYGSNVEEVELLLNVLEKGVDGVVVKIKKTDEIGRLAEIFKQIRFLDILDGEVTEVENIGVGDRACVDTVSILDPGEGMLVGNFSRFFFLIHNEGTGSPFTSPRPFRVNAGAVHCYVMMADGTTKYLSELSAGMRVLVTTLRGRARPVTIGRVKIEKRPLKIVRARVGEAEGSVILQDAETIRLVSKDGEQISVTELNPGEKVKVHVSEQKARHFGKAVEEFIIER